MLPRAVARKRRIEYPRAIYHVIGVATPLRRSGVPYRWWAQTLRMGSPNSVHAYVTRFQGERLHTSADPVRLDPTLRKRSFTA